MHNAEIMRARSRSSQRWPKRKRRSGRRGPLMSYNQSDLFHVWLKTGKEGLRVYRNFGLRRTRK
jgi:hypothetical protein